MPTECSANHLILEPWKVALWKRHSAGKSTLNRLELSKAMRRNNLIVFRMKGRASNLTQVDSPLDRTELCGSDDRYLRDSSEMGGGRLERDECGKRVFAALATVGPRCA